MKSKIFISYSRKDYDVVVRLRDEIHRRTGSLPWMDLSGIETGAQFADVIAGAIDECNLLVFVISRNSVVSEWTRREVLYALEMHKKVYPVAIDEAQIPKELRLLLSNLNCIDIRDAVQRENLFSDLAIDVTQKDSSISSSSHRRGPVAAMINGIKALRFRMTMALLSRRSWMFYAVIGILFLIAGVCMYAFHRGSKGMEAEIETMKGYRAGQEAMIAKSLRESFNGVLSKERAMEEARKIVAGGDAELTPAERAAFKKSLGLDALLKNVNESVKNIDKDFK